MDLSVGADESAHRNPNRVGRAVPRRRVGARARHLRTAWCRRNRRGVRRLAALEAGRGVARRLSGGIPGVAELQTAPDGVIDASNKVQAVAAKCPDTKIVPVALAGSGGGRVPHGRLRTVASRCRPALPARCLPRDRPRCRRSAALSRRADFWTSSPTPHRRSRSDISMRPRQRTCASPRTRSAHPAAATATHTTCTRPTA